VRPGVITRPATSDDLDGLVTLCLEARSELQVGSQLCTDDPQRLRDQLLLLMSAPGGTVLAGLVDDEVDGLLLARVIGPGPFSEVVALGLEALYVRGDARRRGLGHGLLVAAANLAEEVGATEVYASPLPGARGMHRFLARIGFAPAAAHRVVTTSALQRRLAQEPSAVFGPSSGRQPKQRLEDLIARRRQARASQAEEATSPSEAARQARASISMQVSRAVQTRRPSSSTTTIS
jgi:GNAT superfamily N-acetyltransferase